MAIPIGLQLYSVREDLAREPAATLKAVADMGYSAVEFAGELVRPAGELKMMLDDVGLKCCGWHVPWGRVQLDALQDTIVTNRILGNRFAIIPGFPEELRRTRADWLELADFVNRVSDRLARADMLVGYHNHFVEFAELEGEAPWDTFFRNTNPSVVMQLDTGNAMAGKADVVSILKRYPGRAVTVHLKPFAPEAADSDLAAGFRPMIGEDGVPWDEVFSLCETTAGTEWYIVEYESDAYPPIQAVDVCLRTLRRMGR